MHLQLISVGVEDLDWTSANFPDFVAKTGAAICGELQSTLLTIRQHMEVIRSIADSWSKVSGMDLFSSERGEIKLAHLQGKHRWVESACRHGSLLFICVSMYYTCTNVHVISWIGSHWVGFPRFWNCCKDSEHSSTYMCLLVLSGAGRAQSLL